MCSTSLLKYFSDSEMAIEVGGNTGEGSHGLRAVVWRTACAVTYYYNCLVVLNYVMYIK